MRLQKIFFAAALAFVFCLPSALSRQLTPGDRVLVPVMYATDRALSNNIADLDFTNEQIADEGGAGSENSLSYGIKTVKLFLPLNSSFSDNDGASFGCTTLRANDREPASSLMLDSKLKRDEFIARAKNFQEQSLDGSLIIFVHGCCTPHAAALQKAAALSIWYKRPVLVYDWSSPQWDYSNWFWTKADYHRNEDHCAASERRFTVLLDDLEKSLDAENLSIVAHRTDYLMRILFNEPTCMEVIANIEN